MKKTILIKRILICTSILIIVSIMIMHYNSSISIIDLLDLKTENGQVLRNIHGIQTFSFYSNLSLIIIIAVTISNIYIYRNIIKVKRWLLEPLMLLILYLVFSFGSLLLNNYRIQKMYSLIEYNNKLDGNISQ